MQITTTSGIVAGEGVGSGIIRFSGVRYGELDSGDRFAKAVPPTSPKRAQDRRSRPAVFPQMPSRLGLAMGRDIEQHPQEEDAFLLNVWAPENAERLPVLVFVHGGAFVSGAGTARWYDGRRLAELGMIVVTVNYRLGILGHLVTSTPDEDGNRPLADLLLALRWIRDNVAAFGGDPASVTLSGQSAGAVYTQILSALPSAKGLFRRACLMSAAYPRLPGQDEAAVFGQKAAIALPDGPLDSSVEEMLSAQALTVQTPVLETISLGFTPVRSGSVPDWWFDAENFAVSAHVSEVLVTHTKDEAGVFFFASPLHTAVSRDDADEIARRLGRDDLIDSARTPYQKLVQAVSWDFFVRPAIETVESLRRRGIPAELLVFGEDSPLEGVGSGHCFDLAFLFGERSAWSDAPMLRGINDTKFDAMGRVWRRKIASFVRNGVTYGANVVSDRH